MAKKMKQSTPVLEQQVKELADTIMFGEQPYNINAKHAVESDHTLKADMADEASVAGYVKNKLTINLRDGESTDGTTVEFDGSTAGNITVVPATGGDFSGPITVPPQPLPLKDTDESKVLNFKDTNAIIRQLTGSGWFTWNGALTFTQVMEGNEHLRMGVVIGPDAEIHSFSEENYFKKYLPLYLYISKDTGNLYLGNSTSRTFISLAKYATMADRADNADSAVRADSADKLSYTDSDGEVKSISAYSVSVNIDALQKFYNDFKNTYKKQIDQNEQDITEIFDSITNLKDTLENALNGAIERLDTFDSGVTYKLDQLYENVNNIVSGATTVSKATKDSDGRSIKQGYYRKYDTSGTSTIRISTAIPVSGGNKGDIWITYNA